MKKRVIRKDSIRENGITDLMVALLQIDYTSLTTLQKNVLGEIIIKNKSFKELSESLKLTPYRLSEIFKIAVKKVVLELIDINPKFTRFKELQEDFEAAQKKINFFEIKQQRDKAKSPRLKEILSTSILSAGFTTRLQTICNSHGIYEISDLVKLSKFRFTTFRNCGKKSIDEVENFFSKNGLSWRMNV